MKGCIAFHPPQEWLHSSKSVWFHDDETLIYYLWYIAVSAPDLSLETHELNADPDSVSTTLPALMQLRRPLLDYRIIIAILKGDVGAINILKDALKMSKNLSVNNMLLTLGPTTPLSLRPPNGSRILWTTYTDRTNIQSTHRLTIVPPNQLTDISLGLEKLSQTRTGRVPLLVGDFLDNVLSVSADPAGLYSFLCKLFTRIRTNRQTAFFLATEEMHDPKKTAALKRFADVVIEYRSIQDPPNQRIEARVLDHLQNHYDIWDSSENADIEYQDQRHHQDCDWMIGRQNNLLVKEPAVAF